MLKKMLLVLLSLVFVSGAAMAVDLSGAGATFPYPIYSKWISDYSKATGNKINYQPIGSGCGIRQFTSGIVDFGGSDAPMTNDEISKAGGDILHIPTVMGAVSVVYNLPRIKGLKLDANSLAGIFLGNIKMWNDDAIAKLNTSVNLPNKAITVAHRSDGSGTTDIFTNYLAKVSTGWASKVGAGKAVNWPVGVGGKGNSGVAGVVKVNEGAIGYVELSYAMENNLSVISLKNRAGYYVIPSLDSTSASADGALSKIPSDFRADLTNAPGKNSYPIVGMTWLLVHKNQKDTAKGKTLVDFLKWSLTDGQKYAADLYYAPLPKSLQSKVLKTINTITY